MRITGGVIIFGVGLETASHVCSLGIILCVMFYATSKALIYAFLGTSLRMRRYIMLTHCTVEKVHIVWAPVVGSKRSNSVIYRICSFLMLGYIAIIILMFIGKHITRFVLVEARISYSSSIRSCIPPPRVRPNLHDRPRALRLYPSHRL
jgi:hypothetical protein